MDNNDEAGQGGGPAPGSAPAGQAFSGGASEDSTEECVICLTDPKDTILLPCRHLCVCSECFRHVDKCPVCRSAFDNYIVLQGASDRPAPQASTAPSLVLPTIAGPSRAAPPSTEAVVNAPGTAHNAPGFRTGAGVTPGRSRTRMGVPGGAGSPVGRGGAVLGPSSVAEEVV